MPRPRSPFRRARVAVLLALLGGGCAGKPAPMSPPGGPLTPEQAIASAIAGSSITVEGTVFTTSFDSFEVDPHHHPIVPGRYLLIRTVKPRGVSYGDIDPNRVPEAFALGLFLSPAQLKERRFPLPQNGDLVRATGTYNLIQWSKGEFQPEGWVVAVLRELKELTIVRSAAPLGADRDEPCAVDMSCRDDLICDRKSQRCVLPPLEPTWGSEWRDVNGACSGDDDCPAGQSCELAYRIRADGEFAAHYRRQPDIGRGLCVVAKGASLAAQCPRLATTADLVGFRFAPGKEICVRGEVIVAAVPEDRDTHVQLLVEEGLPYPRATAAYEWFGASVENSPPYKDPSRPQGALTDPVTRQKVVVVGTYRYDDDHGWFEVHPFKQWWPAP